MPHISIVICTNNRLKKIVKCLNSLSRQRNTFFSVIVVDGRKDNRLRVLIPFFKRRLNITHIKISQNNLPYARNIGIQHAGTDFIVFLDDDTIVPKNYIDRVSLSIIRNEPFCLIGGKTFSANKGYIAKFSELILSNGIKDASLYQKNVDFIQGVNMIMNFQRIKTLIKQKKMYREQMFDETKVIAGDDTELCLFIRQLQDQAIIFDPIVIVFHSYRNNFFDFLYRQVQYAKGDLSCAEQYQDFTFVSKYFWKNKPSLLSFFNLWRKIFYKDVVWFCYWYGIIWFPLLLIKHTINFYVVNTYKIK